MPKLPGIRSVVSSCWLLVYFLLATSYLLLATRPAYAAESPTPLPCENPIVPSEEILTYNWLVDENRNPPANLQGDAGAVGPSGASVTVTEEFYLTVDFSKLGAIFGRTNSNYLEGKFYSQDTKTIE